MIYNLIGQLVHIDSSFFVINCGGVGFQCNSSQTTLKKIGNIGDEVETYTYLSVKEDALDLYGFSSVEELNLFKLLITVNGVGPKAAISVLSELPPDKFELAVASGDVKSITRANGVGKKSAERIILELKDKLASNFAETSQDGSSSPFEVVEESNSSEAVAALVELGYSKSDAVAAVGKLDKSLSVSDMIRQALRTLAKRL